MIIIECQVCKIKFEIKNNEKERRFCCSKKCGYSRLTKYKYGDEYNINIEGESRKNNQQKLRLRYRAAVLDRMGNKCVKCSFSDKRALQIDHINGGGRKERKKITNTNKFYQKVVDSIDSKEGLYQLLCANCNVIKRIENEEHNNTKK